jgi:nicotinamidase-related amidase
MALSALDRSSALVVIDLQNGIVGIPTRPHAPSEVVARTVTLADALRVAGRPVVLVRVSLRPDGSDAAPGRTEVAGCPGSPPPDWDEIVDALAGHSEGIVVIERNWGPLRRPA